MGAKKKQNKTKSGPAGAEAMKQKGNEAFMNKHYETAVNHYTKAIELDGNNPVYYSNRAQVYIEL